ncbi:hypothetical protein K438DRAFT_1765418 [Mycena galopus ATCC 62051]|nr:hypothetical protein K438DRAFT_1765418 [Mycena galopus ATCC 62051]
MSLQVRWLDSIFDFGSNVRLGPTAAVRLLTSREEASGRTRTCPHGTLRPRPSAMLWLTRTTLRTAPSLTLLPSPPMRPRLTSTVTVPLSPTRAETDRERAPEERLCSRCDASSLIVATPMASFPCRGLPVPSPQAVVLYAAFSLPRVQLLTIQQWKTKYQLSTILLVEGPILKSLTSLWLGGSLAVDILIASVTVFSLLSSRRASPVRRTETLINHIIVITAVAALLNLTLCLLPIQGLTFHTATAVIIGKLYSNVLMANLNGRAHSNAFKAGLQDTESGGMQLNTIGGARLILLVEGSDVFPKHHQCIDTTPIACEITVSSFAKLKLQ